jgi:putative ABC transport system permease protein
LSNGLWQRQFGGDPSVVGRTIDLDLRKYTVVGVLPAGFQGLEGSADIWVTVHRESAESLNQPWAHAWQAVARLKAGVTTAQATSAVTAVGKAIDEAYPSETSPDWGAQASPLNENRLDPALRDSVLILFGAVVFVVMIACLNVANLLLVRGSARGREIAIRSAIGAGRGRILRQLLTESLLLAILGGAASLMVAYVGVRALSAINPADTFTFGRLPGLTQLGFNSIRLDSSALAFTFATALLAGVAFGLAPAWHTSRADLTDALKKKSGRSFGFRIVRAKNVLVVVEVALALVLLAGAGLMLKSFSRLTSTPIGVDPNNVLTARLSLPPGPEGREDSIPFFAELERRIGAQTGVISTGVSNCHALAGFCGRNIIMFRDRPPVPRGSEPAIPTLRVSADYFKTMKIPLLRGRVFSSADDQNTPKVAIVNESAAKQFWPGEDPVGKHIGLGINGFAERVEVIGVVGDVRYGPIDRPAEPNAYITYRQGPNATMVLFVRTHENPSALAPILRRQVQSLNPNLPVYDVKTMQERIGDASARMRFNATLLGIFALIAVVLAAVGIFGVMSYIVRQNVREIGIRMALGAEPRNVVFEGLRQAGVLVFAGTIIGLPGALAATRVLKPTLYQVTPTDPQTYVLISILLVVIAVVAGYIPARRASAVEPSITLRSE